MQCVDSKLLLCSLLPQTMVCVKRNTVNNIENINENKYKAFFEISFILYSDGANIYSNTSVHDEETDASACTPALRTPAPHTRTPVPVPTTKKLAVLPTTQKHLTQKVPSPSLVLFLSDNFNIIISNSSL